MQIFQWHKYEDAANTGGETLVYTYGRAREHVPVPPPDAPADAPRPWPQLRRPRERGGQQSHARRRPPGPVLVRSLASAAGGAI